MVGRTAGSGLGTTAPSRLGTTAAAQAPVGLLVASRPTPLWLALSRAFGDSIRAQQVHREPLPGFRKPMEEVVHVTYRLVLAMLATLFLVFAAIWYIAMVSAATPPMSLYRNVIMAVAVTVMALTAGGLIGLMFYSRRKGYDEPARSDRDSRM